MWITSSVRRQINTVFQWKRTRRWVDLTQASQKLTSVVPLQASMRRCVKCTFFDWFINWSLKGNSFFYWRYHKQHQNRNRDMEREKKEKKSRHWGQWHWAGVARWVSGACCSGQPSLQGSGFSHFSFSYWWCIMSEKSKDDTLACFPSVRLELQWVLGNCNRCGLIRISLCRQDCPLRSSHLGQRGKTKASQWESCLRTRLVPKPVWLKSYQTGPSLEASSCSGSDCMIVT